ncbi:hypothetical protein H8E77_24980, partial [bacterium]|nr:hypothetical protein [bacterium]
MPLNPLLTQQEILNYIYDTTLQLLKVSSGKAQCEEATLQDAIDVDGNGTAFDIAGLGTLALQVLISGAGTTIVNFEVTVDDINWAGIKGSIVPDTGSKTILSTTSGIFHFDISGFSQFRARISNTIGVVEVTVKGAGVAVGTGGLSNESDTELETDDLDTGVGEDTQAIVGIALAESGGHTLVGSANPIPTDVREINGNAVNAQSGNRDAGTQIIGVADDDNVSTKLTDIDGKIPIDPATDTKLDEIKVLIGEVQASPPADTVLARLKDLLTGIVLATGSNAIGKLAANSGVDIGDVDVTSLPVGNVAMAASTPVTIASDDTLITAIKTAVEIIDNAISGTEMQVDVVASLPAGTNAIGKLA